MPDFSHFSTLEFDRETYNQAVAPGITRPLHAPGHPGRQWRIQQQASLWRKKHPI